MSSVGFAALAGQRYVVVENKLTFLTLPALPGYFASFGSGFAVELLKVIAWLAACPLIYWATWTRTAL